MSDRMSVTLQSAKSAQYCFSAPGRTELSGNHTDHQHGRVLAAAVNLEMRAQVSANERNTLCVRSEGFGTVEIDLNDLAMRESEKNTTAALVRGIATRFTQNGAALSGLDISVTSTVLPGSGLSSSAAFEVLIGTILNHLFCGGKYSPVEIAQIGQWAENTYFGKPCGLMDQTASSVGGIISIDFADPANPVVEKLDFDFSTCGHALCIIDSGADHADLTEEYAAITREMKAVAALFGKEVLRDVDEREFYARLPEIRSSCGDRAVLRAMHFFAENERVRLQVRAIKNDDFGAFLNYVTESGRSSWMLLQNVIPTGSKAHQDVAFALTLAERILNGRGAVRVHGGGFAGTIQAFVPNDMLTSFKEEIERILGAGSCHVLSIRQQGGCLVEEA